jgi:phage major head subunit gpT-like protein
MTSRLTFRGITGTYYKRLEEVQLASFVPRIASIFTSDQPIEEYPFLDAVPALKEWLGPRAAQVLSEKKITVANKKFQAAIDFEDRDFELDKSGQALTRTRELGARAAQLPMTVLSTLLTGNGTAYDGIAFFGDRTAVKTGGRINNALTKDVTTPLAPTSAEMSAAILESMQAILSTKDEAGEPMHPGAMQFGVLVPVNLMSAAYAAVNDQFTSAGVSNTLQNIAGVSVVPMVETRLPQSGAFYVFRMDTEFKPLIWQDQVLSQIDVLTRGSDYYFENHRHRFGVLRIGAGALGNPSGIVRYTFT